MNTYILFDKPQSENKSFISRILNNDSIEINSPKGRILLISWLKGCLKVLLYSRRSDTIICWYDFQAVLCWWICHLTFMRRKIVCINILLKDKSSLRNKIVSYLYKKSLLSSCFSASVTSVKYGEWLNKKLGIDAKYTLIHDVYHDSYRFEQAVDVIPNSVFCGGNNGRDWKFIIEVARKMPNIKFNIVMPHDIYLKYHSIFTKNMNVRYDIPYNEFMKELCSSSIVCLPLDTQAPAGLIVMFQAAANLKPLITTKTVTTMEYINKERGIIISNELDVWVNSIKSCLENIENSNKRALNFRDYLYCNCSEEIFVNGIKRML